MITSDIRVEKESLIEKSYKRGLKALNEFSDTALSVNERDLAFARYFQARSELINYQKAYASVSDDLSDYCCTLGLDLGDQMEVLLDKELAA